MLFSSKEGWCFLPLFCQEQWVCFDYINHVLVGADLQLLSLSYTQTAHLDPDPEPPNFLTPVCTGRVVWKILLISFIDAGWRTSAEQLIYP